MFDALIQASLRQRLFVLVFALVLTIAGLLTLRELPVDVFPDLNRPTVTLMTEAEGMAPEEVEQRVSFPLETAFGGLPGVLRVRSVSSAGLSIVYVEFDWGTDIYRNRQLVAERLGTVASQLPPRVVPVLGPVASIMGQVMLVALQGEPGKADAMQVREAADWIVRPRLLTIPGVAQVIAIGGEVRQYRITPDTRRMRDLGVRLADIEAAAGGFATNTSGGFVDRGAREVMLRNVTRTTSLEDLAMLPVAVRNGTPVLLRQVAEIGFSARTRRGDAGYGGEPAVILSVEKQPQVDTVRLTAQVEQALAELGRSLPAGVQVKSVLFRQADFIDRAIGNVERVMVEAALAVLIVLFAFLLNVRTTAISLVAIPLSLLVTVLVFHVLGLSINTMTLGGIAIAIGELVDDAIVDVENVLRRLRENRMLASPRPALEVVGAASVEIRSSIVYATAVVVLVFLPLFALSGIEGRLFTPLGIAYVMSILASLLVAVTVTPVLCYLLLARGSLLHAGGAAAAAGVADAAGEPQAMRPEHGDSPLVRRLKAWDRRALDWSFDRQLPVLGIATALVVAALATVPWFARSFLPQFNEGTLTINLLLDPGTSLTESNRVGVLAERLLLQVPEVRQVGRRTGRAELDEHAEGVHSSEIEVDLEPSSRSRAQVVADIRARLAVLPVSANIGQPISHRLDHLLSGIRAEVAVKIFGDDLDTLSALATQVQTRLSAVPGLVDLQTEKQVRVAQQRVRIDPQRAAAYGIAPAEVARRLQAMANGEVLSQVNDGVRRFDVVLRLADADRSLEGLASLPVDTPSGPVPLGRLATIEDGDGPNQVGRESARRRIVVFANTSGRDTSAIIAAVRAELDAVQMPEGYFTVLEGQFQAQEAASRRIAVLALVSLLLVYSVLYSRYRSAALAAIVMANVPMAMVGGIVALWISGGELSIASLVGFVTLAGIAARNGILKISHYVNLALYEGEVFGRALVMRGSLERLTPVLMTALTAAVALSPLLFGADDPGKEILNPVAV
ncbi:MAG: efflux RND transporter permease subunit, partial [Rhodocyclaceae bacterium]|nr:efflux RND transporter permease subunit [Rhodocyclaceae bacterium]